MEMYYIEKGGSPLLKTIWQDGMINVLYVCVYDTASIVILRFCYSRHTMDKKQQVCCAH